MKPKRFATVMMFACAILFATHTAQAFYNPSTGRWLSRDPIEEAGSDNLYGFVGNKPVSTTDLLGLVIETSCDPIDDYLKSLGITYTRTENYLYTFSGTDIGTGNASDKLIVTRMLAVGTVFKVSSANGSATDNLKKHVEARMTIVRNALQANFLFDTHVFKFDREAFYKDPQAYFDRLNNGQTVIACTALSRIIFETGNKHNPQGVRKRSRPTAGNLIWIPGDWGWIANKGVISKPGYEGENVFHTGKSGEGEMFWGHFKPGVHPPASESWWFDFITHWPGGGIPEWRDEVSYTLVGLERPTTSP